MVVALHDTKLAATSIAAIYSVVLDALTRRMVELAVAEIGEPDAPFAWLALGSQARREAVPSSDVDSAIVWYGDADEGSIRPHLHDLGTRVVAGLTACGLRADEHGATASDLRFVRSEESWRRVARSWLEDPTQEKALLLDLGARRQPAGVGHPRRDSGRRGVLPGARAIRGCCASSRASRSPTVRRPASCAASSSSTAASAAVSSTSSTAASSRSSIWRAGPRWRRASPAPRPPSACASPATPGTLPRATRARCSRPTS